jgi:hypothetical protein
MTGKTLADDFGRLLTDSVSIAAVSEEGPNGPTYGTATIQDCFARRKNVEFEIGSGGVVQKSVLQIWMDGDVDVGETDMITYDGESPPILKIGRTQNDRGGTYATVIYTGSIDRQ